MEQPHMSSMPVTKPVAVDVDVDNHTVHAVRIAPPTVATDGTPLPTTAAHRPTLVFLHEALGNIALWRDFPVALCAATGCPGLVYDRLGFGTSDDTPAERGADYLHWDGEVLLPGLLAALDIRTTIPVGHSDGGTIALLFAAARPDLALAVITEAAHVFVEADTVAGIRAAEAAYATGTLKERLARYHGARTESVFRAWADTWQAPWFQAWDITGELSEVTCPVLALQGSEDRYGTRAQLDAIAAGVRGPVTVREIPGCGHVPHHQARRAVLAEMVEFVTDVSGVAPAA